MKPWNWTWGVWSLVFLLCVLPSRQQSRSSFTADEWMESGREDLNLAINLRHHLGVAKNVILFIGDGMGVSTVTAARIFKGQRDGQPGEETQLNFEQLPHAALAKTYSADKQVSDSAATSTAFLGGVKANSGTLGVDARVSRQNCSLLPREAAVSTIMDWAREAGKWTGLVTTTQVTHATPAAGYAHSPERDWESDTAMTQASDLCKERVKDIARQLVEDNSDIRVILGGGRKNFMPFTALDPDTSMMNMNGRQDGRDLVEEWLADKRRRGAQASYVWDRQQLETLDVNNTDFLLGLFSQGHMEFDLNRNSTGVVKEPSLAEMVSKAIGVLSLNNTQGFFLLVEGGRIDHAHHANRAHLALGETVALDLAVGAALNMTAGGGDNDDDDDDTLLVVTADHSHVFTMGGYPDRGHDILGLLDPPNVDRPVDNLPYTTLSYANGPGPGRVDLSGVDTTSIYFQQSRLVPTMYETHAGEDVPIYARGPMAHLFHGVHEQNYIAHVMAYASCVGPYKENCRQNRGSEETTETPSAGPRPCELNVATNTHRPLLSVSHVCVVLWFLLSFF